MGKHNFGRYLFLIARLALGVIFIAASIDKIAHPAEFAKIVHNYQILPDFAVNGAAIILPWVEAVLGALLLAGIWLAGAAVLADTLLLAFFASLVFNMARGLNVNCGCFSTATAVASSNSWYVARDALFLVLAFVMTIGVFRRKKFAGREGA